MISECGHSMKYQNLTVSSNDHYRLSGSHFSAFSFFLYISFRKKRTVKQKKKKRKERQGLSEPGKKKLMTMDNMPFFRLNKKLKRGVNYT